MKFSIGAIQYFWQAEHVLNFYNQAVESSADIVYVGESVCPKRRELRPEDYLKIAHQLREAGKEVVLTSLTLLESPADVRELKKLCDNGEFVIEANDMGAVGVLSEKGLPFVGGMALNCFNGVSLRKLVSLGMSRIVLPVELHREWAQALFQDEDIQKIRNNFEVEIFAFGHIPLAWSARCFTARSEGLPKDACQLCCLKYPTGRRVNSREGEPVFVLNGIQTQSGARQNLINDIGELKGIADVLCLSPEPETTFHWLERFRDRAEGVGTESFEESDCNGYWHGKAGKELVDIEML